jgi:hypothetical protein
MADFPLPHLNDSHIIKSPLKEIEVDHCVLLVSLFKTVDHVCCLRVKQLYVLCV